MKFASPGLPLKNTKRMAATSEPCRLNQGSRTHLLFLPTKPPAQWSVAHENLRADNVKLNLGEIFIPLGPVPCRECVVVENTKKNTTHIVATLRPVGGVCIHCTRLHKRQAVQQVAQASQQQQWGDLATQTDNNPLHI